MGYSWREILRIRWYSSEILRTQVTQSDGKVLTAHRAMCPVSGGWYQSCYQVTSDGGTKLGAGSSHNVYIQAPSSRHRGGPPSDWSGYVPSDVIITAISAERSVMLRGYRRPIIIPRRGLSHAYSLTLKERSFHIICQCIVVFIPRLWCHSTHSRK